MGGELEAAAGGVEEVAELLGGEVGAAHAEARGVAIEVSVVGGADAVEDFAGAAGEVAVEPRGEDVSDVAGEADGGEGGEGSAGLA